MEFLPVSGRTGIFIQVFPDGVLEGPEPLGDKPALREPGQAITQLFEYSFYGAGTLSGCQALSAAVPVRNQFHT